MCVITFPQSRGPSASCRSYLAGAQISGLTSELKNQPKITFKAYNGQFLCVFTLPGSKRTPATCSSYLVPISVLFLTKLKTYAWYKYIFLNFWPRQSIWLNVPAKIWNFFSAPVYKSCLICTIWLWDAFVGIWLHPRVKKHLNDPI